LREQEMMKNTRQEEEKLWAQQQEYMRRQQILNDRAMKRSHREVTVGHRAAQEQQKLEHD